MIYRYIPVMPKTALFVLLIIYGNFIPTGENAELCPKYPLGVSNSVSGIIVSSIVTSEKLVNGIISYFYYLGENSVNQIIDNSDKIENIFFKITNKIQDFSSKFIKGIGEQAQSIYGASSGVLKSSIESMVKLENLLQTYTYNKISQIVDVIKSGRITEKIGEEIRNPVKSVQEAIGGIKSALFSFLSNLKVTLIGDKNSFNGGGLIKEIKDALQAPFKATKEFLQSSTMILKNVTKDSVAELKGFVHQLEKGSLTEKLSASLASPVVALQEIWALISKSSSSLKASVASTAVAIAQPLLGSTLTRQLGKLTNLPFDITQGIWNSVKSASKKLDDFVANITGGGRLSVRINAVLSHPGETIKNTLSTTASTAKSLTQFVLGDKAAQLLMNSLNSPLSFLKDLVSSITGNGSLGIKLKSLITKPLDTLKSISNSAKNTISGFLSSITGGGSLSVQLKSLLTKPLATFETIWNSTKNAISGFFSSITGGGSLSVKLKSLFTKPLDSLKSIWDGTKNAIKGIVQKIPIIGGGGSLKVGANINYGGSGGGKGSTTGKGKNIELGGGSKSSFSAHSPRGGGVSIKSSGAKAKG